jgi:hypothetical protein
MLINLAGFVFAAGLMAFVLSCIYRQLDSWDMELLIDNPARKWILRFVGLGLILSSGALFSYSMPAPVPMSYLSDQSDEQDFVDDQINEQVDEPVQQWLSLMDEARYEDAWRRGAPGLQQSVSAREFGKLARSNRKSLGTVVDRAEISTMDLSSLPDGRQGNFKLHIYRTLFASGARLEEIVVEEADANEWRVLNYNLGNISK